ncbi:MAG: hypothetical protein Q8K54_09390, partial [Gallionella sp.]|nr:hypothetical protein [Gallionella sp.]
MANESRCEFMPNAHQFDARAQSYRIIHGGVKGFTRLTAKLTNKFLKTRLLFYCRPEFAPGFQQTIG